MANILIINRIEEGLFTHTLTADGETQTAIDNAPNLTSFWINGVRVMDFKTKNGAPLVRNQRILPSEITITDSFGSTPPQTGFTNDVQVWNALGALGYFQGFSGGSGGGGVDSFINLTDVNPNLYLGFEGMVYVVNETATGLEPVIFYNYNNLTQLDDVEIDSLVPSDTGKYVAVSMVDGAPKFTLVTLPNSGNDLPNGFTNLGTQSLVDGEYTATVGYEWNYQNIHYGLVDDFTATINPAGEGNSRIDVIHTVPGTNEFAKTEGIVSAGQNTALKPAIPVGALEVTILSIYEDSFSEPTDPITGEQFITKSSYGWTQSNISGENTTIIYQSDANAFELINPALVSIDSVAVSIEDSYNGQQVWILNKTGNSVILNNNASGGLATFLPFIFPLGQDMTIANNGLVRFKRKDNEMLFESYSINNGGASSTNLSYTPSSSQGTVNSDTGTDAVIPLANSTQAGLVSYERYVYNNPQTLGNPIAESMYGALSSEGWILNNTAVEQEKLLQSININTAASGTINFAIGIIDQRGIFLARLEFEKTVVNGSNNIIFNELMKKFEVLAVKLPISANLIGSTYNIDGKLMYTPDGYSGELSGQPYDLNIQLNLQDAIRNPLVFENQLQQLDDRVVILENEGLTSTSPDGTVYEFTANNDGEIEVGGLSYSSVVHLGNSLALHPWSLDPGSYWWGNWGMAASEKEKDYVHQFKSILEESGGTVDNDVYTIVEWEWNYATWDKAQLIPMIDGKELVVIRLGENVSYAPDFKAEFKELLQYILDYNPAVKLLVGGLFWFNELKETAMREATLELGLPFVQLYQLNTTENQSYIGAMVYGEDGELHEITVSGVAEHPGDLGMQRIAETLFSGLGANMKKPLAYKEDVLLKENASEDPQPYTDNIIPYRTEDGSLKMTRVILTESDIFTDNMTAAIGMFNGSNLGVKFSALALKKFINAETTQGIISRNNQQTNTLTMLNASFLVFGTDRGIAFGQGGAVLGYLPITQPIDNDSNPVDQIVSPTGNTGFGKIPTEKVDVDGNVKATHFITENATAENHAPAFRQIVSNTNTSATTLTLTTPSRTNYYQHTGTGSTWTLPDATTNVMNRIVCTHKGSGLLKINSFSTNQIWESGTPSSDYTVSVGESVNLYSDGVNWIVL